MVGPGLELLAQLEARAEPILHLIFIDADKEGYVDYLRRSMPLLREGGLMLGDNALPDAVLDEAADSGTKRYNAKVSTHPELVSILIPVYVARGLTGF